MSDCPECGMRDDDWFLCRREPCAINKTKRDSDRIADLERQIAELRAELSKRQTLYTNSSEAAAWRRTYWQDRAEVAEAENARLRALPLKDEVEREGWRTECATEGCNKPATVHFERGGVGSYYCHDCYMRIQALPAAPSEQGGDRG